jgi:hypothetical protein
MNYLEKLSNDLIVHLFDLLDLISATRLSCCCKRLLQVGQSWNIYRQKTKSRFRIDVDYHDIRIQHEPFESNWKHFYTRLDNACCGWRGMALDPATNNFKPYPMEIVFQTARNSYITGFLAEAIGVECSNVKGLRSIRHTELTGFCRWRSTFDSLTLVILIVIRRPPVLS